jgi:hypothetical protein
LIFTSENLTIFSQHTVQTQAISHNNSSPAFFWQLRAELRAELRIARSLRFTWQALSTAPGRMLFLMHMACRLLAESRSNRKKN